MNKKLAISFLVIILLCFTSFAMHKFYVSVTQIDFVPEKKRFEITSRLFIDDLNKALTEQFKTNFYLGSNRESESQQEQLKQYFLSHFSIKINGKSKTIQFLQFEQEDDVLICYLKINDISKVTSLEINNTLLFNVIPEQQHITHTKVVNTKKSVLLTLENAKELLKY